MANPFVERFGGTLRRELLDHVIILGEGHLKRLLKEFIEQYYHLARPHQGLDGDTPFPTNKPESAAGASGLVSIPVVGGLHHRYVRVAAWSPTLRNNHKKKGRQSPSVEEPAYPVKRLML